MNPSTLASLVLPTLLAWSLADDYQKARLKRGLCNPRHDSAPQQDLRQEQVMGTPHRYSSPPLYPAPPLYSGPPQGFSVPPPPAPQAGPKPLQQRLSKLKAAFEAEGLLPFFHLAHYPGCIRATGFQRSGKTTRVQVLALIRQLLDSSHRVIVATPHKPTPADRPWPSSFQVHGEGNRWDQIRSVLDALMASLAAGDCTPRTFILDEFSGYLGHGGMDNAFLQEFMLSMVRETAKHHCQVILIQHGDTVAMSGGIKGLQEAIWGNFPTLRCQRVLLEGIPIPATEANLVGGGFPEEALLFPRWLSPQWLCRNFPELTQFSVSSSPKLGLSSQREPDFTLDLSGLMAQDQAITTDATLDMPPHLAAVLDYVRRKGTVTPRLVQQAKLSPLVEADCNKADRIQMMLDTLIYSGQLSIQADGSYALLDVGQHPE